MRNDRVKSLKQRHPAGLALLPLYGPSLVPGHVLGGLYHVVTVPAGDEDKGDRVWVVLELLNPEDSLVRVRAASMPHLDLIFLTAGLNSPTHRSLE